jgi:branched-chain amino acid transport system permease protein
VSAGRVAASLGRRLPRAWSALTVAQLAPVLPYLVLVGMLAARPRGLFGERMQDA